MSEQRAPILRKGSGFLLVLTTAGSIPEGNRLAGRLVKARVAACVNLIPRISSLYWWKGRVESGKECLLLIKTHRKKMRPLARVLRLHHSYEVPELIALPIALGERIYCNWLQSSLRTSS